MRAFCVALLVFLLAVGGVMLPKVQAQHVVVREASIMAGAPAHMVVAGPDVALLDACPLSGAQLHHLKVFNTLQLHAGTALSVWGTLSLEGDAAGLVLMSNATHTASIIHHTPGIEATIWRYFPAVSNWHTQQATEWHMLSSPVLSQPIEGFIPETPSDFYLWSETRNLWINHRTRADFETENPGPHFVPGRGYLVAYAQEQLFPFTGEIQVNSVPFGPLTHSATGGGWHLLGNPFASGLNWNCVSWDRNGVGSQVHLYDPQRGNYISHNNGLGDFCGLIPPHRAVFVKVDAPTGKSADLQIPSMARMHPDVRENNAKKSLPSQTLRLEVVSEANGLPDAVYVRALEGASMGYDPSLDALKVFGMGVAPGFYAMKQSELLSIANIPAPKGRVLLGFLPGRPENGMFQIRVQGMDGFADDLMIRLKDLHTGVITDLRLHDSYRFFHLPGSSAQRFALEFGPLPTQTDEPQSMPKPRMYASGSRVHIHTPYPARVRLMGMDGRVLMSWQIIEAGYSVTQTMLKPGVYLIGLQSASGVFTEKVFLTNE